MSRNHIVLSVASECSDLRFLIAAAAEAGVSRIHASWPQLHDWLVRQPIDVTANVTSLALGDGAHLSGMDVSTLAIECDKELDSRTDDAYMQMRVARNLGLRQVTIFGGARDAAAYDYLIAALLRLTTLADHLRIDVLVANRRGTCMEQIDDVLRVLADVGADNLYMDVDIVEFHAASVNPCDACLAFGSRVARIRLSNVDRGCRIALGSGEIHIPAVLRSMESTEALCPLVLKLADGREAAAELQVDLRFLASSGYVIA